MIILVILGGISLIITALILNESYGAFQIDYKTRIPQHLDRT